MFKQTNDYGEVLQLQGYNSQISMWGNNNYLNLYFRYDICEDLYDIILDFLQVNFSHGVLQFTVKKGQNTNNTYGFN